MVSHKKNKYSPVQMVLIAIAIALISYVPLRTIFNIAVKGSIRADSAEVASKKVSVALPVDMFSVDLADQ